MTAYKKKLTLWYAGIASEITIVVLARCLFEDLIFLFFVPIFLVSYLATKIKCPNCDMPITYRPPGSFVNNRTLSAIYNKKCKYCGENLDCE